MAISEMLLLHLYIFFQEEPKLCIVFKNKIEVNFSYKFFIQIF